MASSLHIITSNLVRRSFQPTITSASCFLSINRSYSTNLPKDDFYDQSLVRIMCPKIPSMSFRMTMCDSISSLQLQIPNEGLSVNLKRPGLEIKDMTPSADHNTLFIQGIQSLDNTSRTTDIKANLILNSMANDIITSFLDITAKRSWLYYDMFFDRSILGKGLCPVIAAMPSPINSFLIYKEETAKSLRIDLDIPGEEKIKLTTQGLRVSLSMSNGHKREDVKTYFDYETFFIEEKTKTENYITGIHLAKGIQMRHNMIKREMKDGVFYAFLPCCGSAKELINAQINQKLIKSYINHW